MGNAASEWSGSSSKKQIDNKKDNTNHVADDTKNNDNNNVIISNEIENNITRMDHDRYDIHNNYTYIGRCNVQNKIAHNIIRQTTIINVIATICFSKI